MTAQEMLEILSDAGYDEPTKKIIMDGLKKAEPKLATLKQKAEYDAIEAKANELRSKLEGTADQPGAEAYRTWYNTNFKAIKELEARTLRYKERFGDLEDPAAGGSGGSGAGAGAGGGAGATGMTKEELQRLVSETVATNFGPQWSNLLKGSGKIIEQHIRSGRKTSIDWDKLGELAAAKGGDLSAAYDEWDKPEREAAAKAATDAEIDRRVKEELAKRNTQNFFPAGADGSGSGSGISPLSREAGERKYDRSKVIQSAVTGTYEM